MLFERFEVNGLAHYAYMVGCEGAECVAVVDPERNVETYLDFAARRGVRITHVLETHIHADYASGARELAERAGAELAVSGYDEGERYAVAFPHRDLAHGDVITLGRVRVEAWHSPGHTPEHLAYLVYDDARSSNTPMLMLSGDFLFVGSLGRPDLLGEEAKRGLARRLFASVRNLADLPDGLEIHPAHGAGSMCGAGMGGRPCSTLGFERIANPYLDPALDEAAFVERILGNVPPLPPYYARMKTLNAHGPDTLSTVPAPVAIEPAHFRELAEAAHVIVDLRHQVAFDGAHIHGALGIGAGPQLSTWAAWAVPYEAPLLLVAESEASALEARRCLVRVGLDNVVGYLAGGIEAWRAAGHALNQTRMMQPEEVHEQMAAGASLRILDVRTEPEWAAGHPPGAVNIMGGCLADRLEEIPPESGPIAVICEGGYRSVVASSILERAGYTEVVDIIGGITAWKMAGLPLETG